MVMRAYNEMYLQNAANKFGNMMDYAVNDCDIDGDEYLHMLTVAGMARQLEYGVPGVIAGLSGIEMAMNTIRAVAGEFPAAKPVFKDYRTAEFWGGWALAHYQWYCARSYASILRIMHFSDILLMYPTFHEADITKFYAAADARYVERTPKTNLKRIREAAGFSQSQLAAETGSALRSIQMYEQRRKDINKAQAITLAKIARVLGCEIGELLERELSGRETPVDSRF